MTRMATARGTDMIKDINEAAEHDGTRLQYWSFKMFYQLNLNKSRNKSFTNRFGL